jgi:hypothetical protein
MASMVVKTQVHLTSTVGAMAGRDAILYYNAKVEA